MRREYVEGGLSEDDLAADPITMFARWFDDAAAVGLHEPNAMVLATVSAAGLPSARMVLLKGFGPEGFRFFTNYGSRKGDELAANPASSVLFPWHALGRQVRVEGTAARLPRDESAAYFETRPRASQIGAWASPQSRVVESRAWLDARYAVESERFATSPDVPLPPYWGGYLVVPDSAEFWQGREGRMHDRLRYRRRQDGTGWLIERLAP